MKSFLSACLITLMLFSGCAWFGKSKNEKQAFELIQDGVEYYDSGRYKQALANFEQLKNWYPFSKYAILAELKIADAHYHLNQYPEAIVAYEEFERLHPRNEAIPYVVYQIGMCHFEQMDAIDRDQTPALKALEVFRRLVQQFPDDPHAQLARSHIVVCMQSITGHELYVGRFYFKAKNYKAAMQRFLTVVTQYPDVGGHYEALSYIAKCKAYLTEDDAVVQ
jgi:outer membrane protein assembly factor BamD